MRQLTQDIFKDAPPWVKGAAVDENGRGFYYSKTIEFLRVNEESGYWQVGYNIPFVTAEQIEGFYFDKSNWQHSAIDREVVHEEINTRYI